MRSPIHIGNAYDTTEIGNRLGAWIVRATEEHKALTAALKVAGEQSFYGRRPTSDYAKAVEDELNRQEKKLQYTCLWHIQFDQHRLNVHCARWALTVPAITIILCNTKHHISAQSGGAVSILRPTTIRELNPSYATAAQRANDYAAALPHVPELVDRYMRLRLDWAELEQRMKDLHVDYLLGAEE